MKRKIISFLMVIVIMVTMDPMQMVSAMSVSDIRTQISNTYNAACTEAGVSSFNGYCAWLVNWELVILGINSSYVGGNGNDEYDNYKNVEKSNGGYYITAYPASNYNLKSALNEITNNGTKDAYNILVGFETGSGSAGALYGHVVFIHGIIDGTVYFCESFNATVGGSYYSEGSVIACSIATFASYYDSWTTLDGVIHFQKEIGYLGKCAFYPSHCLFQISSATTYVKSLPCSEKTDASSTNVEVASKGDQYQAISLVENSAGNLWYKVKAKNGSTGYVYAGDTTFVEQLKDDVTVSGVAAPAELKKGSAFSIKGTIATQYQTLTKVGAWVDNSSGSYVTGDTEDVNTTSYNLNASKVDNGVRFNDLSAGKYTYFIGATIKTYYASSATTVSSKSITIDLYEATFSVVENTACNHSFGSKVTTAATCSSNGVRTYTCSKCGASYTETIAATGSHNYVGEITANAYCGGTGTKTYTCSGCSASYTETIPATGEHTWGGWAIKQATSCTDTGIKSRKCPVCHQEEIQTIPATGHYYGSWITTTAAGCTTNGTQKKTCSACGDIRTQTVAASGHNYTSKMVDATCVEYAKTVYTCSGCGDSYVEYSADDLTDWSATRPSGVDESLIESRTEYRYQTKEYTTGTSSSMDGWTLYDTTTQWSDYGEWSSWSGTAATASDTTKVETRKAYGYYYYLCSKCGAHMHGYGSCYTWAGGCGATTTNSGWREVWSATAWDNAGLKDWHGTGKYYAYIDGELVFKWTSGGTKTQYRYCTRTQETVYSFYKWSDWTDWSPSTIMASDDVNVETRTVYRHVEAELGEHKYASTVTAPTCNVQGYTTRTCTVCGDSYKDSYIAALGHNYQSGYCSRCDTKDPNYQFVTAQVQVGTVAGRPGELVTVPVSISSNPGFAGFTFVIDYDSAVMTLDDIVKGDILHTSDSGAFTAGTASKTVNWADVVNTTENGVMIYLTFRISDDAETSNYSISVSLKNNNNTNFVDETAHAQTVSFKSGTVAVEEIAATDACLAVSGAQGTAGTTMTVYVSIENNPGIISLRQMISYDTSALELIEVEDVGLLAGYTTPAAIISSPYTLRWADSLAAKNNTENGKIVKLVFRIKDDAVPGDYTVSATPIEARNVTGSKIFFNAGSAKITVIDCLIGDTDGDGEISDWDAIILNRYLVGWGVEITLVAADVDGDGEVSDWDAIILERYLAGWDVKIG